MGKERPIQRIVQSGPDLALEIKDAEPLCAWCECPKSDPCHEWLERGEYESADAPPLCDFQDPSRTIGTKRIYLEG